MLDLSSFTRRIADGEDPRTVLPEIRKAIADSGQTPRWQGVREAADGFRRLAKALDIIADACGPVDLPPPCKCEPCDGSCER